MRSFKFQIAARSASLGMSFAALVNAGAYDRPVEAFAAACAIFLVFAVPFPRLKKKQDPYQDDQEGWEEIK